MTTRMIEIERFGEVAVLRIDRPPANAIDLSLAEELEAALASIEQSDDTGALVITGTGSCFSAGLDLKVVPNYSKQEQQSMIGQVNSLFGRAYSLALPTIAAVNGHAIAGGLILVLACDYRIGAEGAYNMGLAEVRVGVPYPVAAMTIVQSELQSPVARSMVLLGRNVGPQAALSQRLLDELQTSERLLPRAIEVGQEMSKLPRSSYRRIKRQLRSAALARIDDAISNRNEPMLNDWLNDDTRSAASDALSSRDRG